MMVIPSLAMPLVVQMVIGVGVIQAVKDIDKYEDGKVRIAVPQVQVVDQKQEVPATVIHLQAIVLLRLPVVMVQVLPPKSYSTQVLQAVVAKQEIQASDIHL